VDLIAIGPPRLQWRGRAGFTPASQLLTGEQPGLLEGKRWAGLLSIGIGTINAEMSGKKRSLLDVVSVILALSVLAAAAFFLIAPLRAVVLVMVGRGTGCPLAKAVHTRASMDEREARRRVISSASRVVADDPAAGIDLWETDKGKFWLPKNQNDLLASLLAEQEENIYGSGEQAVHPGDIVLDCGAHVGVFTRVAVAAGAGLVVAIEPAPRNVECLRRNMAAEIASGRVLVVAEGVWDKEGTLPLHMDASNSDGARLLSTDKPRAVTIEVPLTTIDLLVARLKLPRVDFIKMDIEGAEQKALAGAKSVISIYRPRMALCTYHTLSDPVVVPMLARSAWYEYRVQCGPCQEQGLRIVPQTILFY
jgi:FkbM family methyltransferase